MSPDNLKKLLACVTETTVAPEYAPQSYQENWGNTKRGQGRRHGGMVRGAMSDAPRGVKTYHRFLPNLPESEREELTTFERLGLLRYAQARTLGLNHIQAWLIGLHADGKCSFDDMAQAPAFQDEKIGKTEASAAKGRGKPTPKTKPCEGPIERRLTYDERVKDGSVTYRFEPKEWILTYRHGINDSMMSNDDKRSVPKAYAWACQNQDRLPTMTFDEILRELRAAGVRVYTRR